MSDSIKVSVRVMCSVKETVTSRFLETIDLDIC